MQLQEVNQTQIDNWCNILSEADNNFYMPYSLFFPLLEQMDGRHWVHAQIHQIQSHHFSFGQIGQKPKKKRKKIY